MYTYIRSFVLEPKLGAQWVEAQLGTTPVFDIFRLFREVVHVVTHPLYENEQYVDFTSLKVDHGDYEGDLNQWFVDIDDLTLPMLSEAPIDKIKYVQYSNAIRAGYKVHLGQIGVHLPGNYPLADLPDVYLTRPNTTTDVTLIHTRALVTVNGYLHITDTDGEYLWIKDAVKSLKHYGDNHIGITSFVSVCNLKKIPIKNCTITPEVEGRPLYERLDITLNEDLTGKSFMLSIGGYLQMPDADVCWQSGDRTISVCLDKLPYIERYYESKKYLDLSSLELTEDENNPSAVSVEELKSDAVIDRYLKLSQSFVIIADIPNLMFRKVYLQHSSIPGVYYSTQDPVYPQFTGYGKMTEYWKSLEDGKWSIHITDGIVKNHVMSYRQPDDLMVVNDHALPGRTYYHSHGHLLEIGGY